MIIDAAGLVAGVVTVNVRARNISGTTTAPNVAQTAYDNKHVLYADGRLATDGTSSMTVTLQGKGEIRGTLWSDRNQSGWAIDNTGKIGFRHSLSSQFVLMQSAGAGWVRVNFRLGGCFKTWTTDVKVAPGTTLSVKAVLEVGAITEEIVVRTNSEILDTQTATVASTLDADQINRMPTPTRNALYEVEKEMQQLDPPVTDAHGNQLTERVATVTYTTDEGSLSQWS